MTSRSLPINTGSAPDSVRPWFAHSRMLEVEVGKRGERERERAYTELYRTDEQATLVKKIENYYPIY